MTTKRIVLNQKLAALSDEAFLAHWQRLHAPLVVATPDYAAQVVRYIQNHPLASLRCLPAFGHVSLSQFWSAPPRPDLQPLVQTPYFKQFIDPDIDRFLDRDRSVNVLVDEDILAPGRGPVSVFVLVRRTGARSTQAFRANWLRESARLRSAAPLRDLLRAQIVNWVHPESLRHYSGAPVVETERFDAIEELRFDNEADARCALEGAEFRAARQEPSPAAERVGFLLTRNHVVHPKQET